MIYKNKQEKRELMKYYIQLGVVFGTLALIPYVIEKCEDYLDNNYCMWNKNKNCLEEKINEDILK